jgi:hypothetical protein
VVSAWLKLVIHSAAVAAMAVAAQLGAGDALGILRWQSSDGREWSTLLTWIAFSYAVAVVVGALVGRKAVRTPDRSDGIGARITAGLVAAVGAGAAIGLAWLPSDGLRPPTNVNPGLVVTITAGAGVLVGLLLSVFALAARPVAIGLQITVGLVWLVAAGAATAGVTSGEPYPAPRLGVPDAPSVLPASLWTGPRVMIGVAVVVALVVAGIFRARGSGRLALALSGFGGPALVAAAYLVAGPGTGEDRSAQSDAYISALLAVGVGLVASVLVAMPGRKTAARPRRPAVPPDDRPITGDVMARPRPTSAQADERPGAGDLPTRPRPAWAGGSGPYARAFGSGATATIPGSTTSVWDPPGEAVSVPATARGTGWDADTLAGTAQPAAGGTLAGHGASAGGGLYGSGRHSSAADEAPAFAPLTGGGLYRSSYQDDPHDGGYDSPGTAAVMGQPPSDPHESWLRDLGPSGRHAAADER